MKKLYFYILTLFVLSFVISFPFFKSGFFPTHDGEWAVVRLGAMHRGLIEHQFPVRWAGNQNFGYGYPLFEFTYPFPYYFAEIFNVAKLGLVNSIKAVFVLSVFISGIGMFMFLSELFSAEGALLGSVFYLLAPYRLVNLYVRGSIGESLSLAIFPLIFLVLFKIFKTKENKYTPLFSILFAILLLTHNVTSLIFTPFLLGFCLLLYLNEKQKKIFVKKILVGFIMGVLISSFFLIPLLSEKKYIALSQVRISDISRHFVPIQNLITSPWNYGAYGTLDSFSPQLGIVHIFAFLFGIYLLLKQNSKFLKRLGIFVLVSTFISVILMQRISLPFWQNAPLFSDVDFPWRLLAPLIFILSIPVAALGGKRIVVGILFLLVIFNLKYASPKNYTPAIDSYYFTNQATTTSSDELMPIWVKRKPTKMYDSKVQNLTGEEKINLTKSTGIKIDFNTLLTDERVVQINTIYFPGWNIYVDGNPIKFSYRNPKGVITFPIAKGKHQVSARFEETSLRILSDLLSLFSMLFVVSMFKIKLIK